MKLRIGSIALVLAALAGAAAADSALTMSFKTSEPPKVNYEDNMVAVWVEGPGGTFIKSIGMWGTKDGDMKSLLAWLAKSGSVKEADAISQPTRSNHNSPLMVSWDLKDKMGAEVADGT